MNQKLYFVVTLFSYLFVHDLVWAAPENLDELFTRKARAASASWGYNYLEQKQRPYEWQPETLCYKDITTGREVWRLTSTPSKKNAFHDDITMTPWSADGKRLAISSDRDTGAFNRLTYPVWFVMRTDGTGMRPVLDGPARVNSHTPYFHWSPQLPDVYYEFGRNRSGLTGLNPVGLYKTTVQDSTETRSLLLTFPTTKTAEMKLDKIISSDGRKVIAMPYTEGWFYPATVFPENSAALDDPDGYTEGRQLGVWGDSPTTYTGHHDMYYRGDGRWYYILPGSGHTWWRLATKGSAPDGGALYSFTPPKTFGEAWPENAIVGGATPDPFGSQYWSHPSPDRWGRRVLFSAGDSNPMGPGVWDVQKHQYIAQTYGKVGSAGAQHNDWSGFTDWTVTSKGGAVSQGGGEDYGEDRLFAQNINDPASQITVCFTHTLYNNSGVYMGAGYEYSAIPRPAQSPDGTKVAYHSTFLNPKTGSYDDKPDVFWAVVMKPFPPTSLGADGTGGVRITWLPPKYTTRGWPFAATNPQVDALGWPLLDSNGDELGEPLYAREVRRYHVWRASSANGPWQQVGGADAQYSAVYAEDPSLFMLHPVANGTKVGSANKISFIDNPGNGMFYYAVTTEEHSGLESDYLSEIIQVTVSGGNVTGATVAFAEGTQNYWRTSPPAPSDVVVTKQLANGQYRLDWTEPGNNKIRYYNIYYSATGVPEADQRFLIASVPVGTKSWLDWNADPAQPAQYRITSVDRQGNEGTVSASSSPAIKSIIIK